MIRKFLTPFSVALVVFLGMLGTIVYYKHQLADEHQRVLDGQMVLDSVQAAADSTRNEVLVIMGDSIELYRRRAIQTELKADSLDRALKASSVVRVELEASVAGLNTTITQLLKKDSTNFTAQLQKRIPPYTVDLAITIPRTLETVSADVSVMLDTAHIGARIVCKPTDQVRSAELVLTPPEWLGVVITEVKQDPSVCNPELATPKSYSMWRDPKVLIPGSIVTFELLKLVSKLAGG